MTDTDFGDELYTRLKNGIDLQDLRDPRGKGVEFEIDERELNRSGIEEDTDLHSFNKDEVVSNLCLISDNEDDVSDEEPYLTEMERLRKRMLQIGNDLTPKKDGGVLKKLQTPGIGCVIPEGSLVKVHYNAYTDVGQPPYDSTRLRGQELKFRLGKGEVITGLELAVLSMKKHELSRFLIHPNYAYGEKGCPPRIPREASLIFDIEVLHFVDQEGVDDYYSMSAEERRIKMAYTDIEKVIKAENAEGKEYFANRNYQKAFGKYKRAQNILEGYHLKNEEEERLWKKQITRVYMNCAICCFNISHYGRAISYCNDALKADPHCVKAFYFKGKALHSLGSFKDAKESLLRARNLQPADTLISKALQNLARSMKEHEQFEKNMYQKMFTSKSSADDKPVSEFKTPNTGAQVQEDEEEDCGSCSDRFKQLVKEQFDTFQQDSSMTGMPFPAIQMTPAEIACIIETATSLGMDVKQRGTGNSTRYEVIKKIT